MLREKKKVPNAPKNQKEEKRKRRGIRTTVSPPKTRRKLNFGNLFTTKGRRPGGKKRAWP